jgi:ABC-type uncharacterized transport system YnjBCD substrate-binding protein
MHASDNAFLATGTAANVALPPGARDARWNSGFVEAHYYVNPQFVVTARWETVRMSQQTDPATPTDLGNVDAYSGGIRWYPIMFSRAGLSGTRYLPLPLGSDAKGPRLFTAAGLKS